MAAFLNPHTKLENVYRGWEQLKEAIKSKESLVQLFEDGNFETSDPRKDYNDYKSGFLEGQILRYLQSLKIREYSMDNMQVPIAFANYQSSIDVKEIENQIDLHSMSRTVTLKKLKCLREFAKLMDDNYRKEARSVMESFFNTGLSLYFKVREDDVIDLKTKKAAGYRNVADYYIHKKGDANFERIITIVNLIVKDQEKYYQNSMWDFNGNTLNINGETSLFENFNSDAHLANDAIIYYESLHEFHNTIDHCIKLIIECVNAIKTCTLTRRNSKRELQRVFHKLFGIQILLGQDSLLENRADSDDESTTYEFVDGKLNIKIKPFNGEMQVKVEYFLDDQQPRIIYEETIERLDHSRTISFDEDFDEGGYFKYSIYYPHLELTETSKIYFP